MNKIELLRLAGQLTENLIFNEKIKLNKQCFFMFSISKFIFLKEKIIKKTMNKIENGKIKNSIYFDNIANKKYIPIIMNFYNYVKQNGVYNKKNIDVILLKNTKNAEELKNAIICFNKIRDTLAHGNYEIDFINEIIKIDNSNIKCDIPLSLLNSFTFYINNTTENKSITALEEDYKLYLKNLNKKYDFDILRMQDKESVTILNNDILESNKKLDFQYNSDIDQSSENNSSYLNGKISIFDKINVDYETEKLDFNNYDYELFLIYNSLIYDIKKLILKGKIDDAINSLEELLKILNLPIIKCIIKNHKTNIYQNLKNLIDDIRKLYIKKLHQENIKYRDKTFELIKELNNIMGNSGKNADISVTLYNYLSLLFSNISKKDIEINKIFSNVDLEDFNIYIGCKAKNNSFNIYKVGTTLPDNINFNGSGNQYMQLNETIKNSLYNLNSYIEANINNINLINSIHLNKELEDIKQKIKQQKAIIITSIRNAIEHGNYVLNNNKIILFDQNDHLDFDTTSILLEIDIENLFLFARNIEDLYLTYNKNEKIQEMEFNDTSFDKLMKKIQTIYFPKKEDVFKHLKNYKNYIKSFQRNFAINMNMFLNDSLTALNRKFNVHLNKQLEEILEICREYNIDYNLNKKILGHIPIQELNAKIKYLKEKQLNITVNGKLHEIFRLSRNQLKVKYGISLEKLINEYLEKKVI